MKKLMFMIACVTILLGSCTIQKRQHLKGFYITYKTPFLNKKVSELSEPVSVINEQENLVSLDIQSESNFDTFRLLPIIEKFAPGNPIINKIVSPIVSETDEDVCDMITMKNGDEVSAKIIEIGTSEIKYKKCDNPNGPLYSVSRNDVFMIKYSNGTKEMISPATNSSSETKPFLWSESEQKEINFMALLGFILSFFVPILGLIISIIGLKQIQANPEKYAGRNFAVAGIIIGSVWMLALCFLFLL